MMKKLIAWICVLFVLATISISIATEDHDEGYVCFRRIDANQDDVVTKEELSTFFPGKPELFQKVDQDQDGKITHDEHEEYWYSQDA